MAAERLAIFVDVQNVYYTTRQAFGRHFDYNAFWSRVTPGRDLVVANAYAVERGDARQRQFQNILRGIGFSVKLKPYIQRSDGSAKGDWDVGITLDAMETAPLVDRVVLLSGDGDFDLLVARMRERHGVIVDVFGVRQLSADSLIRAASEFVAIDAPLLMG
ncbi:MULTISPECIES: NYN domain-containing protein [Halomonadaceae]|uniref:LabA-like NYN domain-containing protein n=1 Tax=Halomonadaceae TaxID=28256 RepID=UPI001598FA4F|nr:MULTISPECIES: NYN domain-containing protein [Halomonas]QJQ94114.1 NYN domain-containing protein [Halomonas sp. PA5]